MGSGLGSIRAHDGVQLQPPGKGRANLRLLQSQLGKNHCKLSTMVGEHFEMSVL